MKIEIRVVEHNEQRYESAGDWYIDDKNVLQIRVSRLSKAKYSALIAIHELVEVLIESVRRVGHLKVPPKLVEDTDLFDKNYEYSRPEDDEDSEPGAEPDCPVYQGHMAAMAIEHVAAMILGVNWNEYQKEIVGLCRQESTR